MTNNQQRAAEAIPDALRLYYPDVLDEVAAALDEAEARGRAEVVRDIEAIADELERLTADRRRIAGATPCCDSPGRLRALVHGMAE